MHNKTKITYLIFYRIESKNGLSLSESKRRLQVLNIHSYKYTLEELECLIEPENQRSDHAVSFHLNKTN